MPHRRSVNSTELVKVGLKAAVGPDYVDITTGTAEMAILLEGIHPEDSDYVDADWETISGIAYAVVMVGPGGDITLELTDEVYVPWVKITIGDQIPEIKGGPDDVIEVY